MKLNVTYDDISRVVDSLRGLTEDPDWFSMSQWVNNCGTTHCLWGNAAKECGWTDSEIDVGVPADWSIGPRTGILKRLFLMSELTAPQVVMFFDSISSQDDFFYFNLTGADLRDIYLTRADLARANLAGANLTRANLTGANLTGANLKWADLTGADLTGANLAGANLKWADLKWVDLIGANLTGANLTGANLMGTIRWAAPVWGGSISQEKPVNDPHHS
jgi:hypothetical protein